MAVLYTIPNLPLVTDLESKNILRALVGAHKALAELKGSARTIPNPGILIDTLAIQEASASSRIENIVTTQDQVFQIDSATSEYMNANQKEVARYRDALFRGYEGLQQQQNILSNNIIISMFQVLKDTDDGFRRTPGTELRNDRTGETVYIPPQSATEIVRHMDNLEKFVNDSELSQLDPLLKMAVIHHQFESIHPFSDGNGRIGRIINVLYLVQQGLLDIPILYLSGYITRHKDQYYNLLQSTRDTGDWEEWLLFILSAVEETATQTSELIQNIRRLMADYKSHIRAGYRFYSQDLLNNLFRHPYTRIEYVEHDLGVSRQTASKYLEQLHKDGFLAKIKRGLNVYYVNGPLVDLFDDDFGD